MGKLFINRVWFVAVVAAMVVVFAGCEAAKPAEEVESGAKKVATYEGGEITQGELDEQLDLFAQQSGAGEKHQSDGRGERHPWRGLLEVVRALALGRDLDPAMHALLAFLHDREADRCAEA